MTVKNSFRNKESRCRLVEPKHENVLLTKFHYWLTKTILSTSFVII